jgi:hypothetical protein
MPWGAAAVAGAAIVGSVISSDASQNAASTQANAATQAANTQSQAALQQQQNLLAAGQQAAGQFTPYANYGTGTALSSLTANNDYFNRQFNNQDLNANLAPNYAFQLGQGQNANLMASNVTGGAVGGNALKSLQDYTQGYAGNAYQQAFNNFQTQRGNISAIDLANTGLGLSGSTGSANAQIGTATNIANLGIGSANAQAAGINAAGQANAAGQIGSANAYAGATNSLGNLGYMAYQNYSNANPYSSMGLSGSNGQGFTYNSQVGPTQSGGNLSMPVG